MNETELRPCPFCGAPAETIKKYYWRVRCVNPQCRTLSGDWVLEGAAILAWNRRADFPAQENGTIQESADRDGGG